MLQGKLLLLLHPTLFAVAACFLIAMVNNDYYATILELLSTCKSHVQLWNIACKNHVRVWNIDIARCVCMYVCLCTYMRPYTEKFKLNEQKRRYEDSKESLNDKE